MMKLTTLVESGKKGLLIKDSDDLDQPRKLLEEMIAEKTFTHIYLVRFNAEECATLFKGLNESFSAVENCPDEEAKELIEEAQRQVREANADAKPEAAPAAEESKPNKKGKGNAKQQVDKKAAQKAEKAAREKAAREKLETAIDTILDGAGLKDDKDAKAELLKLANKLKKNPNQATPALMAKVAELVQARKAPEPEPQPEPEPVQTEAVIVTSLEEAQAAIAAGKTITKVVLPEAKPSNDADYDLQAIIDEMVPESEPPKPMTEEQLAAAMAAAFEAEKEANPGFFRRVGRGISKGAKATGRFAKRVATSDTAKGAGKLAGGTVVVLGTAKVADELYDYLTSGDE